MRKMQARVRFYHSIGVGIGVLLATTMLTGVMLSTEAIWRVNNHGKSFDDLIERLDDATVTNNNRKRKKRLPHLPPDGNSQA